MPVNIVGLDACKIGWCAIGRIQNTLVSRCFKDLDEVIKVYSNLEQILIDIPIGLSSESFTRTVDVEARKHLKNRKSSIFSPPCREALYAKNYKDALQINKQVEGKGISIQAYNIAQKIKEVDEWIDKNTQNIKIFEAHPELCFKSLNGDTDLEYSKHDKKGIELRQQIIFKKDYTLKKEYDELMSTYKRNELKPDDILDAMALYLINRMSEKLKIVTDENIVDETGKRVGIVYGQCGVISETQL